jgi:SAM-dependent methyltransferase
MFWWGVPSAVCLTARRNEPEAPSGSRYGLSVVAGGGHDDSGQPDSEQGVRDREYAELVAQVSQLTEERDTLKRRLQIVHSSRSWALTAPVRRLAAWARSHTGGGTSIAAPPAKREPDIDLPPPLLRARVTGSEDAEWFRSSGRMALEDISAALADVSRSLGEFTQIYDFGCGCGRISLPLTDAVGPLRLTASDADSEAIEWLSARLPAARIEVNDALPPPPFVDDTFDLIIGWSVFTHLPERYQDEWLAALARLLAPNGVMLLTVHGPTHFDLAEVPSDDPRRMALPEEGIVFFENYGPDSPFAPYYQTTYHHPDYIYEHWSKWINVVGIRPGGGRPTHDMVVATAR